MSITGTPSDDQPYISPPTTSSSQQVETALGEANPDSEDPALSIAVEGLDMEPTADLRSAEPEPPGRRVSARSNKGKRAQRGSFTSNDGSAGTSVRGDEDEDVDATADHDQDSTLHTAKKRKVSARSRAAKAAATRRARNMARLYERPYILEDPKSPLANMDLRAILLHPMAWDILSLSEKKEILTCFPDEAHILNPGTDDARPNIESLRSDNHFRHDCAMYQENLSMGRHDPDWLHDAWVAHVRRNRGDFDLHLVKEFENDWGVKLPPEYYSGASGKESETPGNTEEQPNRDNRDSKQEPKDQNMTSLAGQYGGEDMDQLGAQKEHSNNESEGSTHYREDKPSPDIAMDEINVAFGQPTKDSITFSEPSELSDLSELTEDIMEIDGGPEGQNSDADCIVVPAAQGIVLQ